MRQNMRAILVACLFATVVFLPGISMHTAFKGAPEGYVADVLVIDLNCEEETKHVFHAQSHNRILWS